MKRAEIVTSPQMSCNHLELKLCRVGETKFYKCMHCNANFTAKPLTITVSHPQIDDRAVWEAEMSVSEREVPTKWNAKGPRPLQ